MQYDIIIVGAGLGGLTAGAKLAKAGKKVLLLEQHDRPGGCATTFMRKDFTMEVGLHEMDGLHRADPKLKIFNDLGIMDKVDFLELPDFYRFVNERYDIVIPHNPDEVKEILYKSFPDEKEGIDTYFYHVLNARKIMKESQGQKDKSLGEFLDNIIHNEDLKLVLLGNLGYFHDDPYSLSYYYYINAQGAYYNGRANFIKGGSQQLSDALVSVIEENGGTVKLNSLVTKINLINDKPSGVNYQNGKGLKKLEFSDEAPEIIINAAIPNLANDLLPNHLAKGLIEKIKGKNIGASLLTVYFGFNKALKDIGNPNYSTFIYHESVKSQKDILKNNHSDFNSRSFTFVDYSHVDSELAPKGKSVGAVCCVDYPEDWESLSPKEYKEKKACVAEVITERCNKLIPGFRDAIEYVEVATSLTVKRYTLNPKGAVYGFAQNPDKSTDYLSALPENIHIASAWGKFGGGFSGAIISGYMTAFDILRKA
ncbi:MAG: NAD(P)/FAD-dependent oxidoreductase [Bacteroidales bacterium]|nr:NAD(P)/FAD-dependent oxidoreductase [Bacteroidales bacterium]MCF8406069.1 NAD(P)/FAD-dependent oxidoreductase [Bacteroidales bacterium]